MKGDNLTSAKVYREPDPVFVFLIANKAPQLVTLDFKSLNSKRMSGFDPGEIEVIGQLFIARRNGGK